MRLDTGYDLLYLTSDLYLRAEQLFRLLYSLTCNDLTYLELQLFKVIKGDLFLWLDVDARLLFSSLLFRASFLCSRCGSLCLMQLLCALQHLFYILACEQDFRLIRYLCAGLIQSKCIHFIQATLLRIQL